MKRDDAPLRGSKATSCSCSSRNHRPRGCAVCPGPVPRTNTSAPAGRRRVLLPGVPVLRRRRRRPLLRPVRHRQLAIACKRSSATHPLRGLAGSPLPTAVTAASVPKLRRPPLFAARSLLCLTEPYLKCGPSIGSTAAAARARGPLLPRHLQYQRRGFSPRRMAGCARAARNAHRASADERREKEAMLTQKACL